MGEDDFQKEFNAYAIKEQEDFDNKKSGDLLHLLFKTQENEVFGVDTGKFTGRSPNDKWIVKNIDTQHSS